ncbi:MAG: hypothetical protein PHS14_13255 [Elusimicrobia bacterium]|nr:hypothetical protein [Elusimicrobiota bacterium]
MTNEMRQELNGVKVAVSALGAQVNALQTDVGVLKTDVGALKTITHNLAITVTGHTEALSRIERRLTKLDELDGLKEILAACNAEVIASRSERELRLTRIELRGKQS